MRSSSSVDSDLLFLTMLKRWSSSKETVLEVKPVLEAAHHSLVRPVDSNDSTKGESSFEDEVERVGGSWRLTGGGCGGMLHRRRVPHGALEAIGPVVAREGTTGDHLEFGR
jgi:hypothetical protein